MTKKHKSTNKGIKIAIPFIAIMILWVGAVIFVFGINHWSITITLNGSETVTVEYGSQHEDSGAEARLHGSLIFKEGWLVDVTVNNNTDMSQLGQGTITYSAEKFGLKDSIQRNIVVVDRKAPEINLIKREGSYTIPGEVYQEEGFTAIDNYDGDLTSKVEREEREDGIIYRVTDSSGNTTEVIRTIIYDDPIPPEIILEGDESITLNVGTAYEEPGFSAADNCDGDLTEFVEVSGSVDMSALGTYTLTYTVKDNYNNSTSVQRTIYYVDRLPPEINLAGSTQMSLAIGTAYTEPGYIALDNHDGDLTSSVEVSGSVDSNRVGVYILTYTVTDSNGNTAIVKRTIQYVDIVPPTITLEGSGTITLSVGTAYVEPGYAAADNYDGDLTSVVKVSGSVNVDQAGTYTITYSVTDDGGNTVTAKRTVVVNPGRQPDTVTPTGKIVYLTFDDGPSKYTQKLLDILAKYNVKATFFTLKNRYSDLMTKEAAAGHTVAIHTNTHEYSEIYASEAAYFADLRKQQALIYEKTGIMSKLVRFPGGSSNVVSKQYCNGIMTTLTNALNNMGYKYFDWNVDSKDAGGATTAKEVYQNVIGGIQNHDVSIVLQHDTKEYSVDAVEAIIVWGLTNGYTFLPLDETSPTAHHTVRN